MTTSDTRQTQITDAIAADVQAAVRSERGEFVYATRAEVVAFVNALPSGVRAQWTCPNLPFGGGGYRVTFRRPSLFEAMFTACATPTAARAVTEATAAVESESEVSEHDR